MSALDLPAHLRDPNEFHPFARWQTLMAAILGTSAIATVFTNGFVFVLIYRWKKLRTLQNILIMSLAVPDFLLGISKMIEHLPNASHRGFVVGDWGCQFAAYADLALCCQSVLGVLLLSLERYLAIVRKRYLTARQVSYILPAIFFAGILLGSMPYWFGERYVFQSSMVYCCPNWSGRTVGAMIVNWACFAIITATTVGSAMVYISIFKMVRANRLQWANKDGTSQANRAQQRAEELEAMIAKKFAIIVGVFCFNWTFYNFNFLYQGITHKQTPPAYDSFAVALAYWNSFCNPIICIVLDERWRKATKATFGFKVTDFDSQGGAPSISSIPSRRPTKVAAGTPSGDVLKTSSMSQPAGGVRVMHPVSATDTAVVDSGGIGVRFASGDV
ncbi:hypothetical protein BC832DRAFT_57968 [Gaertneriomyces semiglobifer]|nr:hypothetical protein BC832DRAFT_57968 [Gaertneriomyces semiglobifer]